MAKRTAADVLHDARERITNGRWIKGRLTGQNKRGEKSFCSVGAILNGRSINSRSAIQNEALIALANEIDPKNATERPDVALARVMGWNDWKAAGAAEVEAAFRRAEERSRISRD